jgi:hypothetical protein
MEKMKKMISRWLTIFRRCQYVSNRKKISSVSKKSQILGIINIYTTKKGDAYRLNILKFRLYIERAVIYQTPDSCPLQGFK